MLKAMQTLSCRLEAGNTQELVGEWMEFASDDDVGLKESYTRGL